MGCDTVVALGGATVNGGPIGSTAMTRACVERSRRVSFPVPAPTSATVLPRPSPARSAIQRIASSGYEGRARS